MFNDFFTSVFTEEDCTSIPQYQLNSCNSILTEITITPAIVLDKLKQLNPTKSFNDFVQFQQDINSLAEWASKWQLKFNVST